MYTNTWTGTGIGVAILDTGLYPHIDFGERIRGFQDFLGHRPYPYDDSGHGTHVAGILAGDGTASDRRYQGVAPGCHLVAAKVLDRRGNGRLQDVLRALQWISFNQNLYGIRIINISVGAAAMDSKAAARLIKAVEQAWDQGFVVVTAAGNMGPAYGSVTAPGSSKKVITVGASDMLDRISSVSGAGPQQNVSANRIWWPRGRCDLLCQQKKQLCHQKRNIDVHTKSFGSYCFVVTERSFSYKCGGKNAAAGILFGSRISKKPPGMGKTGHSKTSCTLNRHGTKNTRCRDSNSYNHRTTLT